MPVWVLHGHFTVKIQVISVFMELTLREREKESVNDKIIVQI